MIFLSVIDPSKKEFDDAVSNVLKRPEYKSLNNVFTKQIENIKEYIWNLIMKLLKKVFSNIEMPSSMSGDFSTVFMIIGILAIFAVVTFISIKIYKSYERKTRIKEILGEKIDDKTTPNSLKDKALTFEKAGDFRQAIRYDFIALLLLMHEKNIVYLDETKTNEEIYKYLKNNSFTRIENLNSMINIFNSCWYGHKLCNEEIHGIWKSDLKFIWDEVIGYEEESK